MEKKTILVAEDEAIILMDIKSSLKKEGYSVVTALRLDSAMKQVKQKSIDLLISDLNLGGENGIMPLLNYMKEFEPEIPVILYSGTDRHKPKENPYCHSYVVKGTGMNNLISEVERLTR